MWSIFWQVAIFVFFMSVLVGIAALIQYRASKIKEMGEKYQELAHSLQAVLDKDVLEKDEDDRKFLESRLGTLVSLWNLEQQLKNLRKAAEEDGWKPSEDDPDDEDAFGWVPAYCRREVRKLGYQFRELDKKDISNN